MTTSLIDAESLLAIDIGSINTRAILFDVVEGRYRYLGTGTAPSTAGSPYHDISEGVRMALDQLQEVTGRTLLEGEGLVIPSKEDGSGVDACVATLSAGPPLKVMAVGLLEDISAASAENLATTTYAQVIETMSLNDRRKTVARLDTVLRLRPDLIVITGGTENGASRSVMNLLEGIGLACAVMPKEQRPAVLFAGNSALADEVQKSLGSVTALQVAPNVRPSLEIEQLTPAQPALAQVYRHVRARQIRGVQDVDLWTNGRLMPTATAFGRTIRFISKEYAKTKKGVLGIDVGASATVVASGFSGDLLLSIQSHLGLGENLPGMLDMCSLEDILRWMPVNVSEDYLRDYMHNKALYPAALPMTPEELAIEQALACQAIHLAVKQAQKSYPAGVSGSGQSLLPWFEPIIASGSVLTQAPTRGQALLTLLNALQPTGVTTIALDRNNLAAALGAAAGINQFLTIQSLDATNFLNLSTIISPVGVANSGTPILQIRMTYADGHESNLEVKAGVLAIIPLPMGQFASLHLQPLHRFDVGMGGPGRGGSVKVMGGVFGVVIDARGRPLRLSADPVRRREVFKKWLWTFGS
jgi:hypothetical protein